jgi:uncharacterized protein with GYD domain
MEASVMAKYAFLGGYTEKSWAGMVQNPEGRGAAVRRLAEAAGGKLETFYWAFGEDDFLAIFDVPDDDAAAAISIAVVATGAIRNARTIKLMSTDDQASILTKAKALTAAYVQPGARTPAGVA